MAGMLLSFATARAPQTDQPPVTVARGPHDRVQHAVEILEPDPTVFAVARREPDPLDRQVATAGQADLVTGEVLGFGRGIESVGQREIIVLTIWLSVNTICFVRETTRHSTGAADLERFPMRAAIYARVSTADQNPENQLAELHRYAEARGWTAVVS